MTSQNHYEPSHQINQTEILTPQINCLVDLISQITVPISTIKITIKSITIKITATFHYHFHYDLIGEIKMTTIDFGHIYS